MLPSHLFWIFFTNSLSQRGLYEAGREINDSAHALSRTGRLPSYPSRVDGKIMGFSFAAKLRP
jgi:hypothetical protein